MTNLSRQVGLTVALQALAATVLGGPLIVTGTLVNDRAADFYFFRDTLHSLNAFGEYPWWNPSIWVGFPSYYINILYSPGREPLFSVLALVVWLLGRVGITIASYHALYVAYLAFLVPLLLSLSILALARQVIRRPIAVYFVIVTTAFSPAVILSVGDLGTEVSAYGFFWAAAWLHYLRRPGRGSFALLLLASLILATALTYFALIWNIFFVPACAIATCIGRRGFTRQAVRAFGHVHSAWWAAAATGVVICALPSFVAYSHGSDILSTRADGRRYYEYVALRPGTALEALAISTPGVGFEWTDYGDPGAVYEPRALSHTRQYTSFGYMGMLTLPLACLGLVVGQRHWAVRLWGGIGVVMTIAMLSAYSPIFSLLLGLPSPLRGVNHYSDLVLRLGLFALLALAAGLGVESVLQSRPARRWALVGIFAAAATASAGWLIALQGAAAAQNFLFGLALAFALLYGIGLCRLALARTPAQIGAVVLTLLPLVLIDTSAFAFAHLRLSLGRVPSVPVEPGPETIGSVIGREETDFLYLRGIRDETALVTSPGPVVTLNTASGHERATAHDISIVERTYNRLTMRVRTTEPARLEWRDAHFPFWRAWINGTETSIDRTSSGMKAVRVPAGESTVVFRFSPTTLRVLVALSYVAVFGTLIFWLRVRE